MIRLINISKLSYQKNETAIALKSHDDEFEIVPLKMWVKGRHSYETRMCPNTHLRGRPRKQLPPTKPSLKK